LLPLLRRYQEAEAAPNTSGPLSNEESDAWADANAELLKDTFGLPALTAASALAALDVVIAERVHAIDPNDFEGCLDSLFTLCTSLPRGKGRMIRLARIWLAGQLMVAAMAILPPDERERLRRGRD
jgi:hypothetical protein